MAKTGEFDIQPTPSGPGVDLAKTLGIDTDPSWDISLKAKANFADVRDVEEARTNLGIYNLIDDVPVDGQLNHSISSNWAYDHANGADPHTQYLLIANIDDTPVNGETSAPISSNWAYDHANALVSPHPVHDTPVNGIVDIPISSNWAYDHDLNHDFLPISGGTLTGPLTITGNLNPAADNTYDFGGASSAWKDLYFEGVLTSTVVDSASAVGFRFLTDNTLSTSGAAHSVWDNNSVNIMELSDSPSTYLQVNSATHGGIGIDCGPTSYWASYDWYVNGTWRGSWYVDQTADIVKLDVQRAAGGSGTFEFYADGSLGVYPGGGDPDLEWWIWESGDNFYFGAQDSAANWTQIYLDPSASELVARHIRPDGNNTRILGTSSYRWQTVYGTYGNFTGNCNASTYFYTNGYLNADKSASGPGVYIDAPNGGYGDLEMRYNGTRYAYLRQDSSSTTLQRVTGTTFYTYLQLQTGTIVVNDQFRPNATNTHNLGGSSYHWNVIYYNGGSLGSDERKKKDITPLSPMLGAVMNIVPKSFRWKPDNRAAWGFIAQEVKKHLPEGCPVSKHDRYDEWSLDPNGLVAVLWQAVRELNEKVERLENGTTS